MGTSQLSSRKAGRRVHYRLSDEARADTALLDWLRVRLERLPGRRTDRRALRVILCHTPEEICARQRRVKCC